MQETVVGNNIELNEDGSQNYVRELNVREEIGLAKIKDSSGERFKKLRKQLDALGGEPVLLDLSTLEVDGYPVELYDIAKMPNVTIAAPENVVTTFQTYAAIVDATVRCVVREHIVEVKPENPRIQAEGSAIANGAKLVDGNYVLSFVDRAVSSVGLTGLILVRALELSADKALTEGKGLTVDLTDTFFEGGADIAVAEKLASYRVKKMPVSVIGADAIDAFVQVRGNVSVSVFSIERRLKLFSRILPGTVLRLDRYSDKHVAALDIAGRRGYGAVVHSTIVLFDSADSERISYREVDTDCLYTDADIAYLGLTLPAEFLYPRRMNIDELGIAGMFTGSCGVLRKIGVGEMHQVANDETLDDLTFIRRGLDFRKIRYERLVYGRIMPPMKK